MGETSDAPGGSEIDLRELFATLSALEMKMTRLLDGERMTTGDTVLVNTMTTNVTQVRLLLQELARRPDAGREERKLADGYFALEGRLKQVRNDFARTLSTNDVPR